MVLMAEDGTVIVTAEEIEAARTPKGGWTKAQLAEWGVSWPPPRGWRAALVGRKVRDAQEWHDMKIRFDKGNMENLRIAAGANDRSINSEVNARVRQTFELEADIRTDARLRRIEQQLEQLLNAVRSQSSA